jgi:glycine/D-amino acid oxidase-like deaminating enzyme/nitrite reductase/ring-hydroxylating ferredoxin subunit
VSERQSSFGGTPDTISARQSLWLDVAPTTAYPPLRTDIEIDVAVLGGGIAGLTAALLLKRDGARVAVIEAARVGRGVSGCTTAKVSALQSTIYSTITARHGREVASIYADASMAAVERVAALARGEGIDCGLSRRAAYTYAPEPLERGTVEKEADAAELAGLPVDTVAGPDLPYPVHGAVGLADQIQMHPVRYAQGLATAVQGDGSTVFERTRAMSIEEGNPCVLQTSGGRVRAGHVVVATHYPVFDRGLYFARLEPQRSYCIAARLRGGAPPKSMSISVGGTTRSIRSYDDDLLILGGEGHPAGSGQASLARFDRLETFARAHWDVESITHRWSAQDPVPYDHLPMIGSYRPGASRVWVTTGFMKWGLSSATFAAMILADRLAGRDNPWAATFSPTRLSLRSAHEVAKLGAKFAIDLVGDRLRPPQARSANRVRPGEARIVQDGLGKVGVYREANGTVHAVSLRCTHLGCLLRFNAAELSWDCPCHGSRFAVDGSVLEGPAVMPLERRYP